MTATLILHSGAESTSRAEVLAVPTPEATETWQPVPHEVLIDATLSRLQNIGLTVTREQHGLAKQGQRWFGVFDLAARVQGRDYGLSIGLRNSHDQSFAAAVMMGSRVFVCDNLAMSGEVQITRKHTNQILVDLPEVMDGAMVQLSRLEDFMHLRIEHYKNTEIADRDASHFLVGSVLDRMLPLNRLKGVAAEWRRPSHEEFAPRTAWSLFNAYTEVLKGTSFTMLPRRTQRLHQLLDRFVGTPKFDTAAPVTIGDLREITAADAQAIAEAQGVN